MIDKRWAAKQWPVTIIKQSRSWFEIWSYRKHFFYQWLKKIALQIIGIMLSSVFVHVCIYYVTTGSVVIYVTANSTENDSLLN